MSSRFSASAVAFAIILAAGHASAATQDQKSPAKPQKVSGTAKSAAHLRLAPLGATVESVLAAGRQLNPALRAAALETATAGLAPQIAFSPKRERLRHCDRMPAEDVRVAVI